MKAVVSIIMGSTSDMPVMKKAADYLNEMEIPFEINALSAHRTPEMVENFAGNAKENGIKVVHVISNLKFAKKSEEAGVDAIVCEGFEAGGQNGKEEIKAYHLEHLAGNVT